MTQAFDSKNWRRLEGEERQKLIPPAAVLDQMDIKAGETFLDIGAGIGYFSIPALKYVQAQGKVMAVDIAEEMLLELKKRIPAGTTNLAIFVGEIESLSLPRSIADKALLAFVLHELADKIKTLRLIAQLLRTDGRLAIIEWRPVPSAMGPPLDERIDFPELHSIMRQTPFHLLNHRELNPFQYLTIWDLQNKG